MEAASIAATKDHCAYCFEVLSQHLEALEAKLKASVPSLPLPAKVPDVTCPLFVTWHKTVKGERNLRGCIGTFSPKLLSKLLAQYAIISATQDDRFPPISKRELASLDCDVNLLVQFEDAKDHLDWEIGKHGIQIFFTVNGNEYDATFLPSVAKEWGWTKEETIKELVRKAGYHGTVDKATAKMKTVRYQSSEACLTYEDWIAMKKSSAS